MMIMPFILIGMWFSTVITTFLQAWSSNTLSVEYDHAQDMAFWDDCRTSLNTLYTKKCAEHQHPGNVYLLKIIRAAEGTNWCIVDCKSLNSLSGYIWAFIGISATVALKMYSPRFVARKFNSAWRDYRVERATADLRRKALMPQVEPICVD
jgi:hypothetical protein